MNETPQFLIQQQPRLSVKEAEKIVDEILSKLDKKIDNKLKNKQYIFKFRGTEKEEKKKYWELVQNVRETGICEFLQYDLDREDPVFGNTFIISTPNWQMKVKTEWAGYKKEIEGPCRTIPSEIDLADDIEFYKEETCIESSEHDFDMCFRNYRGFLFSSIALIDCYINRHIVFFDHNGVKTKRFIELKESRNTEKRIEIFVDEFCNNLSFSDLIKSLAWNDFKKLKDLRNEIVHSLNPYIGMGLKEMASNLNLSINGVGRLLKKLQDGQD